MTRFQVTLDGAEADALVELAASELRDPRDQLRMILRQELARLGLLLSQPSVDDPEENLAPTAEGTKKQALKPAGLRGEREPAAEESTT